MPARLVGLRVPCPGPLGPCSPVCSLCVLCFGLRVRCCVCAASLRGAHTSIRTAAVRSRQGLSTCRARSCPSGRQLFVAGRGWVPSGRALVHPAAGVAWHLFLCRGLVRVVRALRVRGTRRPLLLGTCPCTLVLAGGVPLWRASWPRVVRRASSGPVALGAPVRFPDAVVPFPTPWGLRTRLYWVAARGTRRPAENRAHCACRWPPPRQARWATSALYPFGAPRWGCPRRVPPASVLGCVRCGGWRVWTRSLTRPVSRTVRRSTGASAGAPGLFRVDADTSPCGSEDATPGSPACVPVLVRPDRVGRAGLPGAFWCASPFPFAALSFCFA